MVDASQAGDNKAVVKRDDLRDHVTFFIPGLLEGDKAVTPLGGEGG